jgi:hypothetical protein
VKLPFRFFRGELYSGYYLSRVLTFLNHAVREVVDELVYRILSQWKAEEDTTAEEMPLRDEDVLGIGKIAGLFQTRAYGGVTTGSIYFTSSHAVNGKERSERGLFNMDSENFEFPRAEHDEYPDDIDSEASALRRMSVVPEGAAPAGYVPEGTPAFDDAGNVLWDNILPAPPEDGTPYVPFYGEKYLHFEETFYKELPITVDLFRVLFECVQRIRCHGPTIKGLLEVTDILGGGGYIFGLSIEQIGRRYEVTYRLDPNFWLFQRERRLAAWKIMCAQKFKLFTFVEEA